MDAVERLKRERDEIIKNIKTLEIELSRAGISRDAYLRARHAGETRLIEVLDALVLEQEAQD
jgi:hypothetical protein